MNTENTETKLEADIARLRAIAGTESEIKAVESLARAAREAARLRGVVRAMLDGVHAAIAPVAHDLEGVRHNDG